MLSEKDTAIYKKCMAFAAAANERMSRELVNSKKKTKLPKCGYVICEEAAKWSDVWVRYDKGEVSEEEIKFCFHLGFVPEYI